MKVSYRSGSGQKTQKLVRCANVRSSKRGALFFSALPANSCSADAKYVGVRSRNSLRLFCTRTFAVCEGDLGGRGRGLAKGSADAAPKAGPSLLCWTIADWALKNKADTRDLYLLSTLSQCWRLQHELGQFRDLGLGFHDTKLMHVICLQDGSEQGAFGADGSACVAQNEGVK